MGVVRVTVRKSGVFPFTILGSVTTIPGTAGIGRLHSFTIKYCLNILCFE